MKLTCPILGRTTAVELTPFCRDSWSIVRCRETGFVFLADPPPYSQLESEYAWEVTFEEERTRRKHDEPIFSRVSSLAKRAKTIMFPHRAKMISLMFQVLRSSPQKVTRVSVLDIGCGWGTLLSLAYEKLNESEIEMVPMGIEVSRQLALLSKEHLEPLGGKVICASAVDGMAEVEPSSVDIALMSSFLEHESHPLELLKRLHHALTPTGSVILKVPNFDCWNRMIRGRKWCGFRYPDHVNYFTPATLKNLAQEAGFRVVRQSLLDKFPLSDNMYATLQKAA